ncbi:hypothetical protein BGZ98_002473 [Dissophora globulifera]|nr:hypothetical protein BGZ98_002473 [Dissophora globulifera]
MSGSGHNNNDGRTFTKATPYCEDGKRMHVHHINQRDHKDGGNFVMLPSRLHNNKQLHNIKENGSSSTIDRQGFRRVSQAFIRIMFTDIMEGRLRHPAVTEAVRQSFIGTHKKEYQSATKFANRFQSEPRPGGIEVIALSTALPDTPLCRNLHVSRDGKWLSASFNWNKFWLPLGEVTAEEMLCLMLSSITLATKRLCIDIGASGSFYTINFDGGIALDMAVVETMKRADFLLGAFAFGRDARSGALFEPKEGQLPGYKNPILETARLLHEDTEYAAARCQCTGVWLQPTLVSDRPFTLPWAKWWDWWPELVFPKPVFRLTWRLILVDLFGKQAFYDVPEALGEAHAEAKVLLRPFQALMESFQQHGAAWVASEPDLNKVDWYAKIFQVLSLARASSSSTNNMSSRFLQDILPAKASSKTVYEHADFANPLPDSNEVDILSQELETAFTVAIARTSDSWQKKYDRATLHFLEAARAYDQCFQQHLTDSKLVGAPAKQYARDGMRDCSAFTLESILMTSTDWVLQKDEDKFPAWWKPLHELFGQALVNVDRVLTEPCFTSIEGSQARIAASLFVRVLLVHLAHQMLTKFEQLQDLDGILRVCLFMGCLYERMKEEDDGIHDGAGSAAAVADDDGENAVHPLWTSIEQVSHDVNGRLFTNTDKADPFKVLEMVLCSDNIGDRSSSSAKQRISKSSVIDHPLAELTDGGSGSKCLRSLLVPDGKLAQAELTMDTYFIEGNIAASLACALVLVDDQEIAGLSTHNDRIRLWIKASMIAEYAVAQRDLLSARTLVEGVEKALTEGTYKVGSVIESKTAMLSYLTEACTLLAAHGSLFPRASTILLSRAHGTMAKVHRAWFDDDTASKWTAVAEAFRETAKSKDDVLGPTNYACRWLLDAASNKKSDALKCTKGWDAMVATLL